MTAPTPGATAPATPPPSARPTLLWRVGRGLGLILATLLGLVGTLALAVTRQPWPLALVPVLVGLGVLWWLRGTERRYGPGAVRAQRRVLTGVVVALGLPLLRETVVFVPPPDPEVVLDRLAPGQYEALSGDLTRSVFARVVVRRSALTGRNVLIYAEAHALPLWGHDLDVVYQEPRRWLFWQGPPPSVAPVGAASGGDAPPGSPSTPPDDAVARRLVRSALARALSGEAPRTEPRLPEGASRVGDGADTFFGMFPDEFDHRCDLSRVPDGTWEGRSSNPQFPATVRLVVRGGRLQEVRVVDRRSSAYGERAWTELPRRMVEANRTDVDAVTGATRSSLILRSAVFHACDGALRRVGSAPP